MDVEKTKIEIRDQVFMLVGCSNNLEQKRPVC